MLKKILLLLLVIIIAIVLYFVAWPVPVDLAEGYNSFLRGEPPTLPSPTLQFLDFQVWRNRVLDSDRNGQNERFWKGQMKDVPAIGFPGFPSVDGFRSCQARIQIRERLGQPSAQLGGFRTIVDSFDEALAMFVLPETDRGGLSRRHLAALRWSFRKVMVRGKCPWQRQINCRQFIVE